MSRAVRKQISLLVPLHGHDPHRLADWDWLRRYWEDQLPAAEIVIGRDRSAHGRPWRKKRPFSKTHAINNAFRKSHGDIIVILDADAYTGGAVIQHCADRIRAALRAGVHTWFIPYRTNYSLGEDVTAELIASDPDHPLFPFSAPQKGSGRHHYGHTWGALCQIMPRKAFEVVEGADPRFRGWGAEDAALMKALDTLWGHHKNLPYQILHLWHPTIEDPAIVNGWTPSTVLRSWDGQGDLAEPNFELGERYNQATDRPHRMRRLVNEHRLWHKRLLSLGRRAAGAL